MAHFLPIDLSNVVVKIFNKVIANRLKSLMSSLIRETQYILSWANKVLIMLLLSKR